MSDSNSRRFVRPGEALRVTEAARWLGLSPATLGSWRCRRKGPRFIRVGASIRYYESDLIDYIEQLNASRAA